MEKWPGHFLALFLHLKTNPTPSKPRAWLLSLFLFDNCSFSCLSPVLSSVHWLVSLVWIGLWGLKYPIGWPAVFLVFWRSKWPRVKKAQQKLWKSFELICVDLLSLSEAHKPSFESICCYFNTSVKRLRENVIYLLHWHWAPAKAWARF